jgi:predicted neuraminidase
MNLLNNACLSSMLLKIGCHDFRIESFPVKYIESLDVLVVGGGMAGIFAAIAAARDGHTVCLIEPSNVLGGQGTSGGVAGFCGDTVNVNHVFDEMVRRLESIDAIAAYGPRHDRRSYELELCGFVLQQMVREAGVQVYLRSRVIGTSATNGRIEQVDIASSGDVIRMYPRYVIDTSGSCVIAKEAGYKVFHLAANEQLPMSLYFTLWDTGKPVRPVLPPGCPTWQTDEDLPMTTLHCFPTGKVEVKMKVVGFDAADGLSLSEAEMHAREQMMGLIYHLQTKGYQGNRLDRHVLACVSRQIGVREECRIEGEHLLTQDEVMHEAVFDDAVSVGTYHLDYHWPDRVQRAGTGITTMIAPYQIPLRSLVPRDARNLLIAGRSASGDQMAMSSYRVMATCAQMGFAAGKAASLGVRHQCDIMAIPTKTLQASLVADGQQLDLSVYGQYLRQLIMQRESVTGEQPPFASCHASTLVRVKNGRFLCAYFAGSCEGADDVRIWLSTRWQGCWSQPQQLLAVADVPHWNPVLFVDEQGIVHLFFKVGHKICNWQTWHTVSNDQGQTWSTPRQLVSDASHSRGPVKNKPIILSNGDWLAPASVEDGRTWKVFCDRSSDHGRTWQQGGFLQMDELCRIGLGAIQPTLWESQSGHVHMLTRSSTGWILRSDSTDFGYTWTPLYATSLPNNNSGIDLAQLDDGSLALVYNPIQGRDCDWKKRGKLVVARSQDNGYSWPTYLTLEDGDGEYSYPAIIPTRTGMAITYTHQRTGIAFWHGSVDQLNPR